MYLYNTKPIESNKYYYKVNPNSNFMPTVVDDVFNIMINNENKKEYASLIISETLDLNFNYVFNNIIFLNNKLNKDKIKETTKTVDLLCLVGEYLVLIEMNRFPDVNRLIRNIEYLFKVFTNIRKKGEGYNYKKVRLINIDNYIFKGINEKMIKYRLSNIDKDKFHYLTDICEVYHIFLPNIRKVRYNIDKLSRLDRFMLVMNEEEEKEIEKIIGGDKIMKKYREDLKGILEEGLITLEEHEEIERHYMRDRDASIRLEGMNKGMNKEKTSIAKNLLKEKMDISFISKVTGLSENKILSLK